MSEWGTPLPSLTGLVEKARAIEAEGFDVHTVTLTLYNGAWLLKVQATDEDLQDHARFYMVDNYGTVLHQVDEMEVRL